ncbi:hypothetical protein ACHAWF_014548 [Thalassiosira exigua]
MKVKVALLLLLSQFVAALATHTNGVDGQFRRRNLQSHSNSTGSYDGGHQESAETESVLSIDASSSNSTDYTASTNSASSQLGVYNASDPPLAGWMSGKWGIGWRIRAVRRYNVRRLVNQLRRIRGGFGYVLFNLSQGASGDRYLAPHSVLSAMNPGQCPKRDLFGELATAFQKANVKVIAYMATEGPTKLKHGRRNAYDWNGKTSPSVDNWTAYVEERYGSSSAGTLKKAYAEVIVKEFADRYGSKIDGWWFDHASFGSIPDVHKTVKDANPKALLSFSNHIWWRHGGLRNNNPGYEDFTSGHPIPMRRGPANNTWNYPMVTSIEGSDHGYFYEEGESSLGHVFMPMYGRWNNGGKIVWPRDQAVEWMGRVLDAGGAWTWNIPSHDNKSRLRGSSVNFAKVVAYLHYLETNE